MIEDMMTDGLAWCLLRWSFASMISSSMLGLTTLQKIDWEIFGGMDLSPSVKAWSGRWKRHGWYVKNTRNLRKNISKNWMGVWRDKSMSDGREKHVLRRNHLYVLQCLVDTNDIFMLFTRGNQSSRMVDDVVIDDRRVITVVHGWLEEWSLVIDGWSLMVGEVIIDE
jgi:hypothetical protein